MIKTMSGAHTPFDSEIPGDNKLVSDLSFKNKNSDNIIFPGKMNDDKAEEFSLSDLIECLLKIKKQSSEIEKKLLILTESGDSKCNKNFSEVKVTKS